MQSNTAIILVIGGVGFAVITTTIKEVTTDNTKRSPAIYVPIGGVLAAIPLLILADVEPDLAGMIGALIGLGAFLLNGDQITKLANATNPATKLPPSDKQLGTGNNPPFPRVP